MIRIEPVSETSLIIYLGDHIDPRLASQINLLAQYVKETFPSSLVEVVPSYTSLYVQYHPCKITYQKIQAAVLQFVEILANKPSTKLGQSGKLITLPVYYHQDVGPDLPYVARLHQLTPEKVIANHSEPTYTVCAIGFAPGFAFLATVNAVIATPRHAEPRVKIPAGSVGIADEQTAVYPADSPGGWQLIGNCPQPLFSPNNQPMTPFEVGDRVKFEPIDRKQFKQLGGNIWPDWK